MGKRPRRDRPRRRGLAARKTDGLELRTREPRRKVMLNARMRVAATWNHVCILNISTRGLLIQAAEPPALGTYLDVHRGQQAIVGRVVWVEGHRFGVRTQDALPVEAIIHPGDPSIARLAGELATEAALVRRASPRAAQARHEASRMLSRSIEFALVALVAAAAGVTAFISVGQALGRPLAQLSATLSPL